MSISKTKNYLVLNYSASPVGVSTKYDSFLIDGGSAEEPGSIPLTFDEIAVINSKSNVFKIGLLRFDPRDEEEMYEALSIQNWRDILTQSQIEDAILFPSLESMQKILAIENEAYFERIRGTMISLRNRGKDITVKVERMIEQRRDELSRKQRKTSIKLMPRDEEDKTAPSQDEFNAMKEQLAQMQAMMAEMMVQKNVEPEPKNEPKTASDKPKTSTGKRSKGDAK